MEKDSWTFFEFIFYLKNTSNHDISKKNEKKLMYKFSPYYEHFLNEKKYSTLLYSILEKNGSVHCLETRKMH